MKKYTLTILLLLTFGMYVVYARTDTTSQIVSDVPIVPGTLPATTSEPISEPVSVPTKAATTTTQIKTAGLYKDGTYTGIVADAYYGNIQVATIISGGKISDVQFLQYPNDRGTSVQINQQAMPRLRSEAIATQNSNVHIVSGATDSSRAFIQSLESTLVQARV